jgi:phage-related protein
LKIIRFVGSSRADLRCFPQAARQRAGNDLFMLQMGREPDDWKPMSSVGPGVCELRVRTAGGAWRVIYTARLSFALYVLHAFQKTSPKTSHHDLEIARQRYAIARRLDAQHEAG